MDSRKPLNAELNLVPFIDLLSCCISFLLITAVWTQLDQIAVRHAGTGGGEFTSEEELPPLVVVVEESGYQVRDRELVVAIPKHDGRYDHQALAVKLQEWAHQRQWVEFSGVDGIRYDDMVRAMDAARGAGLHDLWIRSL